MATGTVCYWNGANGWIKQTGVENKSTFEANDVMLMERFIESGTIKNGIAVTFTIENGVAKNVTVDTRDPDPEPKPEPEPEPQPEPEPHREETP